MSVITPMQKTGTMIVITQPHRKTADRQRQVNDTVHGGAPWKAAGIQPHFLSHFLQLSIGIQILFKNCLLHHPHINCACHFRGFHRVIDHNSRHTASANTSQGTIGKTVWKLGFIHQTLHVMLLPAIIKNAFPGPGKIQFQLSVTFHRGGTHFPIPEQ